MNSLLYSIYNDNYDITPKWDEKQQELSRKLCAEWETVEKMFGDAFTGRLLELEGERDDKRAFHYYREGVRLMLEALTSATE